MKTDTEDYKLTCLARYLLKLSLNDRRAFLSRWKKNHGEASETRLKEYIKGEWDAIRKEKRRQ